MSDPAIAYTILVAIGIMGVFFGWLLSKK